MNPEIFLSVKCYSYIKAIITLLIIIFLISGISLAKVIIVDDDGIADFTTIQAAIDSASDGDTVFVKAGIYKESILIDWKKNISLLGEKQDSTFIIGNVKLQSNCIFKEFTVTSEDNFGSNGIYIELGYKIVLTNNTIINLNKGIIIPDSPIWGSDNFLGYCTNPDTCFLKIYSNKIINNKIGIYLDGNYLTGENFEEKVNYDAIKNWWGTVDSVKIKGGIYDWEPRIVNFSSWLHSEIKNNIEPQNNGIHQNNIYDNTEWNIYVAHDPVGIKEEELNTSNNFLLFQNYPNPFNPSTTIAFSIPTRSFVSLKIYDLIGKEIITLISREMNLGKHSIVWDASDLPDGVFFYRLQAGTFSETKKLILLK